MYSEQEGNAIPLRNGVQKLFILKPNIIVGTAGLMSHPEIKYEAEEWIPEFILAHEGPALHRPGDIAPALHVKMRDTFEAIESRPEDSLWQSHRPGDRVVGYFVAGYAESFKAAYLFELGAEINREGSGLVYLPPARKNAEMTWIGEDQFWQRAADRQEPEATARSAIKSGLLSSPMPEIPEALNEVVFALVSLVKVESQFNPKRVGDGVAVALIERASRTPYTLFF